MEKVTGSSPVRSTTRLRFAQQNYGEVPRHSPEGDGGHFWGLHHLPKTRVFSYVYILESANTEPRFYVGLTDDLKARLRKHNKGAVPPTAKFRPWRLKTAIAFVSRERAAAFEGYLKSSSGRAFAKKRL